MEPINYRDLYSLQDRVLDAVFSSQNGLYLTGGTCINRFYSEKRFSDDLDFFSHDNNNFREQVRGVVSLLKNNGIECATIVDSRDFVRIIVGEMLKIDLVNDRVYFYGDLVKHEKGYILDNPVNMLANKITAIMGRDEPKDIFDIFLLSTLIDFSWSDIREIALQKLVFDNEILEYRLRSFPLGMLDRLHVIDRGFIGFIRRMYNQLVDDVIQGKENHLYSVEK